MLSQEINDYEKSTETYFKEISGYKSLTKEEEQKLFKDYFENGDESAKDKILKANLKFAVRIAKQYKNRGLSFADLVSEANMGMLKAIDKFDPSKNVKFISYAVWWIRQSLNEAIEKRNNLPAEELPTDHEKNEDNITDEDTIPIETDETYIEKEGRDNIHEKDIKYAIDLLCEELTDRERDILIEYNGLDGTKPKTLEEIGEKYKLTKERVRQINEKTLKKMRSKALLKCITSDIYR